MKVLKEVLVSPVKVSQMLYSKRCIEEAILDKIEVENRPSDDKKTCLLTAIQETVRNDYKKLKDIATVLSEIDETRDIAYQLIYEYGKKRYRSSYQSSHYNLQIIEWPVKNAETCIRR